MPDPPIKIVKVGGPPPAPKAAAPSAKRKTMRTFPRGVLKKGGVSKKIKGVADPTRAPPVGPGRGSTLRILTESGARRRRETIHRKVTSMRPEDVRKTLRRSGLPVSDKTPPHIAREILEGGMEAGMIVSN
jgi:hypothetical protein